MQKDGFKVQPIVALDGISKSFIDGHEQHRVLDGVTLTLHQGDTVALTGPSGSGKSTLLNLIAGFDSPDSGSLSLLGRASSGFSSADWAGFRRKQLGMVFQQFNLLTPLNVRDNIGFPLALNRQPWSAWCEHLCGRLGLNPLLSRAVDSLSGGQQQRVAIARALAHRPQLLLADEPTGNLDEQAGLEVMALLCELAREGETAVLMVTHSETCAGFMQRRWHLSRGRISEYRSADPSQAQGTDHG
ncbi:ABC transporter ATP-binding protein [Shewanella sedimentimangrovi]|uniref:ABC transporter ATP-binding protein n=1 Tax=Shewanella sedimentimangrovi TaxID=2814293 RepID=A0ABX7R238_9GAMM|nr:ABC transporter ATP-binding protein [Shewanella sedimentimangrovi]QSX37877.1 ABC transporter ATP-binding protein [Shewanella sedimentimangrovi]